jgi:3',5'-cyclic AMP phosphodiesterase CpdA
MKLIVVGDPHIEIEPNERQSVDTAVYLTQLVEHINAHHADAAYCLFIGDLTNEGELEAYKRIKKLIEPLRVPSLLMIGNHDNRENFQTVFIQAYKDENNFVQCILDLGSDYRLIVLDSLNAPPYISPDRHVGFLCPKRLAFLKGGLGTAGERTVMIAMHHHPFRIGLPGMDAIRLENENAFMKLIDRFPNVKMLLMGHNHRTISGIVSGLPFSCFKSLAAQTPLDFEALDPAAGIAEPPSYGVLLLSEGSILVHHEDFNAGVKPESDWEAILQEPKFADRFSKLVARMLPEKVDSPLLRKSI